MSEAVGFSQPYCAILAKIGHTQRDSERHEKTPKLPQTLPNESRSLFAVVL
jgi:hypothetical protein